jgi:flagellar basal-body rod protein FlgG
MNGAFYIGAVGLDAQQRALEVFANNIANINTTAFKRSNVHFSELVSPLRNADGLAVNQLDSAPLQGVTMAGAPVNWAPGAIQQTGQVWDVAVRGDGFMELAGPSGKTLLWRGGTLKVNGDGYLATSDGIPLKSMISIPVGVNGVTIGNDGTVSAVTGSDGAVQQIGQIDLMMPSSTDVLTDSGQGYFETGNLGQLMAVKPGEEGSGMLLQGALESSNVQLADEMANVLLAQRAFGANAQMVQAGDQLMLIVNQLRR